VRPGVGAVKIVSRYLTGAIFRGTAVALAVLVGLFTFFTFLEQLDGDGGFGVAVERTVLALPTIVYELVPMCTLLGALIALGALAQNRELVALRAAGVSTTRLTRAVAGTAAMVIAAGMLTGELVAPPALSRVATIEARAAEQARTESATPTWINDGRRFVKIGSAVDAKRLRDVRVYEFDERGGLVATVAADAARFERGSWVLEGVAETRLAAGGAQVRTFERLPWRFSLAPAVVSMVAIAPERLTLPELARYIVEMRETTQSADRYVEAFWRRVAYPLAAMAMVMIALPLVLSPRPRVSAGRRIMIGAGVGLGFYLGNQLASHVGTVYGVPPVVAALAPTAVLGVSALAYNLRSP